MTDKKCSQKHFSRFLSLCPAGWLTWGQWSSSIFSLFSVFTSANNEDMSPIIPLVTGDGYLCFNTFNPLIWYSGHTAGWLARVFNAHLCSSHFYHLKKQRYSLSGAKCSSCVTMYRANIFINNTRNKTFLSICRPFNILSFFLSNKQLSSVALICALILILRNNPGLNSVICPCLAIDMC